MIRRHRPEEHLEEHLAGFNEIVNDVYNIGKLVFPIGFVMTDLDEKNLHVVASLAELGSMSVTGYRALGKLAALAVTIQPTAKGARRLGKAIPGMCDTDTVEVACFGQDLIMTRQIASDGESCEIELGAELCKALYNFVSGKKTRIIPHNVSVVVRTPPVIISHITDIELEDMLRT